MIDRVLSTIEKHHMIEYGETIIAGVSGGPDSVCLLHLLHSLKEKMGIKVYAIHINHMLRGEEALRDENYVRTLCDGLDVPLVVKSFDIKDVSRQKGISLEEAGREVRYREFDLLAESVNASKIAVAHNRNDQAETVLMHIIRGTGLEGLKGMDYKRGRIIRPLLDIDRKAIEDYCEEYKLHPIIDSSNLETVYTRNKIRLDLIPYISKLFDTEFTDGLCRMALLLRDENEYIAGAAEVLYRECVVKRDKNKVWLDISRVKGSKPALIKRVMRMSVKEVCGSLKGLENIHIDDMIELCFNGRTGAEIHLPRGIRVSRSYDTLKIYIKSDQKEQAFFEERLLIPGTTIIEEAGIRISACIEEKSHSYPGTAGKEHDSHTQYFDFESLAAGINIRSRREGDVFKPLKSIGTKKLKEYMIDCKIPREMRNEIPLIAKNNEIVWIVGYKISDKFKVTENTKSVLKLVCSML